MLLKKTKGSTRKSKGKLKNTSRQMIIKTQPFRIYGMMQKHCLKGNSQQYRSSSKKNKKSQINNLTQHLNELEKEEQTKPKVSRRREIIKIKEEINKNRD